MKRLVAVLLVVGVLGAMPVLAADKGMMKENMMTKESSTEMVRQCALEAESIQQKIKRLQSELKRGEKNNYNKADLEKIERMLKEANDNLEVLSNN